MRLRSVELAVPQTAEAADFLERLWGLLPAGKRGGTLFFRGTGDHPYILSVRGAAEPAVHAIEFSGSTQEVEQAHARARRAGAPVKPFDEHDAPGGGSGFTVQGPEAQTFRFVVEETPPAALPAERDRPVQLAHAVVNTADIAASERFAEDVLGFRLSDRTRFMTFLRCNRKHHSLAFARSETPSLNHIAFEMNDADGVMRGIGRLQDAGCGTVWGPGRHGPGNNVFGYFVPPFGGILEYTAEVLEVGDDYRVGGPEDWKWPPGRTDQWGIAKKDTGRMAAAERVFRFKTGDR